LPFALSTSSQTLPHAILASQILVRDMTYDAFISYSHAADGKLAPRVQSGLHQFAKPLLRLRALHVFRDQTSLSATPELWSSIEGALNRSRYFILMASPDAAASAWVQREIDHWLDHSPISGAGKAVEHFLIVLTDGELVWNQQVRDWDWNRTNALPRRLSGVFAEEPLYVDMRSVRTEDDLSLRNPRFLDQIADLAATIRGRSKEELIGEDVRIVRRNRRLAWSAGTGLAILTVIAAVMAYVATLQRDTARSRELAARATAQLTVDPHQSLLLSMEGARIAWTAEVASALRESLTRSSLRGVLRSPSGKLTSVIFSPVGDRILGTACPTAGKPCVVQLWETALARPTCTIRGHGAARFASDGKSVIAYDGQRFDSSTCRDLVADSSNRVPADAPVPHFEVANQAGTLIIRNVLTKKVSRSVRYPGEAIGGAVFSQDDRYVVTWAASGIYSESGGGPTEIGDKTAHVWGVKYADNDAVLAGHARAVTAADFGPDAEFVVTGSDDRTARIWITRGGDPFAVLRGHHTPIRAVRVSPDGAHVVTLSEEGTALLWEPGTGAPVKQSYKATFALRYGMPLPDLRGSEQPIEIPALSADGTTIVARVESKRIGVWDARTGDRRALLADDAFGDLRAWPSPDGKTVVSTTGDPRVVAGDEFARVWDVASGKVIAKLEGKEGPIYGAAYSPDGTFILTVSEGGVARLWSARTLELSKVLSASEGRLLAGTFDSTGAQMLTAGRDSIARVWDTRTWRATHDLAGHKGGVVGAAFSPDGTVVTTVGEDYTRIWDATTGKEIGAYLGNEPANTFISRDCSKIVTGSYGGDEVRVHSFDACGTEAQLMATSEERARRIADNVQPIPARPLAK